MNNRLWSEQDINYLKTNWGHKSLSQISKRLERTELSIKKKATDLNLGSSVSNSGMISIYQVLYTIIGYNPGSMVINDICNKYPKLQILSIDNRPSVRCVDLDDFWKWLKNNQNMLNFKNFEENSLGAEPDWIKIKRKKDKEAPCRNKNWSDEDIELLKLMLSQYKYTYDDFCKRFDRSKDAIRRKIQHLNIKERPIY